MRTEPRGIGMAGKLAEEQINNTGWGFYLNSNNLVLHEAETRKTLSPARLSSTLYILQRN